MAGDGSDSRPDTTCLPPAPKAGLVAIWRAHDGRLMMTVTAGGRATDYEMPQAVARFLATQIIELL